MGEVEPLQPSISRLPISSVGANPASAFPSLHSFSLFTTASLESPTGEVGEVCSSFDTCHLQTMASSVKLQNYLSFLPKLPTSSAAVVKIYSIFLSNRVECQHLLVFFEGSVRVLSALHPNGFRMREEVQAALLKDFFCQNLQANIQNGNDPSNLFLSHRGVITRRGAQRLGVEITVLLALHLGYIQDADFRPTIKSHSV